MVTRTIISTAALAIGIATTPSMAFADATAPASSAESDQAPDGGQLEDIVVTAQKRSENLQRVPISVTAATADAVKAAGVGGTLDIGRVAPGLTVTQTANTPVFFLRGVGTALGGATGDEGSINIVVDDVVYTSAHGNAFSLNNIDRIEVLRGPQGTLFGRNAAGGVISIITRDPQQTPGLDLSLSYGNYRSVSTSAYLTSGVAENLAADLAVQYSNQDEGYGKNLFNGTDVNKSREFSVRSKLVYDDGSTYVRLIGDYNKTSGDFGVGFKLLPGAVGILGPTTPDGFYNIEDDHQPASSLKEGGGSLKVRHEFEWGQVTSISAYRKTTSGFDFDQDSSAIPLIAADFHARERQFTQEVQIASLSTSNIQWIAGGYYLDSKAAERPIQLAGFAFAPIGFTKTITSSIGAKSYSGYAQTTVPLGRSTRVTGGIRYTSDRRSLDYVATTGNGIGAVPPFTRKAKYNKLTWRAAIDQTITDNILAYASVSSGFKSGTFNIFNDANPPIKPEKLVSYEAGVKSELFDRHLRLNLAGFYYDYKSIQVSQISQGLTLFLNSPGEIYGADVDFEVRPFRGFTLSGGTEFLHSKYKDFPGAPITLPSPAVCGPDGPIASPGPRTGGNTICPGNAKGNQLVRAPDFTSTITGAYSVPTAIGKLGASVTYAHSASYPFEVDNRLRQKPTDVVNGQLSWTSEKGDLVLRLWARNFTKERYYLFKSSSVSDAGIPAAPRTYGATLEGHF